MLHVLDTLLRNSSFNSSIKLMLLLQEMIYQVQRRKLRFIQVKLKL